MVYGTDEQKQKFLPSILDGTVEFAIGYSEPSAGSDLAALRTTAVRDGDDYIINGQKMSTAAPHPRPHLACRSHRPEREEAHGHLDSDRAHVLAGILMEATAHDARRIHVLHVLRRRAGAGQFHRRR
jgi:hypothetical protein